LKPDNFQIPTEAKYLKVVLNHYLAYQIKVSKLIMFLMIIPTVVKLEETCVIKENLISVKNKFAKTGIIKEFKQEIRMQIN
jgi:hypothetical protein